MRTKYNLDPEAAILAYHDKIRWLRRNRGILAQVAKQLSRKKRISPQAVRAVYWGEKRAKRVERAFRRLRAPGFETPMRRAA